MSEAGEAGGAGTPIAIVTGGAQGLGRAIALGLGRRGWRVCVADIDAARAADTAAECGGWAERVDLSEADAPAHMVEAVLARQGRLDALVNNAGFGTIERFLEMRAETWDRTLDLNVRAVALATAAAGRAMAGQRRGRIVNITSPASRMALPNYLAYAASKAAVDAITRAAAVALAPFGIQVNSLAPGMMDTALQEKTERQIAEIEGRTGDFDRFLAERTARIPLGYRAGCEEIAEGVIWLVCDAPAYLTAERLNLSGGLDRD